MFRHRMVEHQLRARGIADERVLASMLRTPRHLFVPFRLQLRAYDDEPLPIGSSQTISQPYMVAKMTELLGLTGSETVLEVGTGSGYQAAVLGRLAARVWTIERHPELATEAERVLAGLELKNVRVVVGDGTLGLPQAAPFDAIMVTAAAPAVPAALRDQLKPGGRMVIPLAAGPEQRLLLIEKVPGSDPAAPTPGAAPQMPASGPGTSPPDQPPACHFRETVILSCVFVPLIGEQGYPV
jgi:protein-L-isoaspartate(D-aspartate) O-methyltransferase